MRILFPEPLTAIGEGIAWQLAVPFLLFYLEDPLPFEASVTYDTLGEGHSSSAHSFLFYISLVSDASNQSLLSLVHASRRQRYSPKWKAFILPCISLALHTFSCMIWACDLAKTCTLIHQSRFAVA